MLWLLWSTLCLVDLTERTKYDWLLQLSNHNSTEWVMKNKAATAPITFEEIVTVMINTFKGFSPFEWKWHKEDNFSANVATQRNNCSNCLRHCFFSSIRGDIIYFFPSAVTSYLRPTSCFLLLLTQYLWLCTFDLLFMTYDTLLVFFHLCTTTYEKFPVTHHCFYKSIHSKS